MVKEQDEQVRVDMRFRKGDYDRIKKLADSLDMKVATYCRMVVLERIGFCDKAFDREEK